MRAIFFSLLFLAFTSFGQELSEFNRQRAKTDQGLMIGLGSWATTNMVVSGIGWGTVKEGEAKYFDQMNVLWNSVNLALAIPGYVKARRSNSSLNFFESVQEQHKTEKVFLFNTGLDVGYMASGFILRSEAKSNLEKEDQFNGYGNSLLLQGGFLFLFDITAYIMHKRHAKKELNPIFEQLELSSNGLGVVWNIQAQTR